MHQVAEYVIGAAFVAQGVQSPTPTVPTILGGVVMLNTACAKGPLAAFRIFGPKVHRILDWTVIAIIGLVAALPLFSIESGTRLIIGAFGVALGFISWQSDYTLKVPKARKALRQTDKPPIAQNVRPASEADAVPPRVSSQTSTGDAFGRWAGRTAASGINAYRRRKRG